jgi:hypothetical protein
MSVALDWQFTGTAGAAFTGDSAFSLVVGSPTYAAASYGKTGVHFPAAAQGVIQEVTTFSTTTRTVSRIHKISGPPLANAEILQFRVGAARGPGMGYTTTGVPIFFKTNSTAQTSTIGAVPIDGTEFRVDYTTDVGQLTITVYPTATSTTPIGTQTLADSTTSTVTTVRDGFTAAAAFGAGVTLDVSWPRDETTATSPGPRSYSTAYVPTTDSGGTYTNWTKAGANAGTGYYAVLADVDDTTYVESATNPSSSTFIVPIPAVNIPSDLTSVSILVRAELASGASTGTIGVALYQGATLIKTGASTPLTTGWVDYVFNLTSTEAASMTNTSGQWLNLTVRPVTTAS